MVETVLADAALDFATLDQGNTAIIFLVGGFFLYLLLPRGLRKQYCYALPRRFSRSGAHRYGGTRLQTSHLSPLVSPAAMDESNTDKSAAFGYGRGNACFGAATKHVNCLADHEFIPNHIHLSEQVCRLQIAPSVDQYSPFQSSSSPLFVRDRIVERFPVTPAAKRDIRQEMPSSPVVDKSNDSIRSGSPQSVILDLDDSKKLIVLMSKGCLDKVQADNQEHALAILKFRMVPYELVDGMDPFQRTRRNELQKISGIRASYPQFFFHHADGSATYLGDWKVIQKLHHAEGLPRSYRVAHPEINTWEEVFGDTSCIFGV